MKNERVSMKVRLAALAVGLSVATLVVTKATGLLTASKDFVAASDHLTQRVDSTLGESGGSRTGPDGCTGGGGGVDGSGGGGGGAGLQAACGGGGGGGARFLLGPDGTMTVTAPGAGGAGGGVGPGASGGEGGKPGGVNVFPSPRPAPSSAPSRSP
jgi:hypothetical protein